MLRITTVRPLKRRVAFFMKIMLCWLLVASSLLMVCCAEQPAPPSGASQVDGAAGAIQEVLPRLPVQVASVDAGIGNTVENFRLTSLMGATFTIQDLLANRRGVVIAMASVECPIAKKYAPRMAAIERDFEGQFEFVHVNTVDGESSSAIQEAVRDVGFRGYYVRDDDGMVRSALRPRTTTEVYVLDAQRRLVYRGAIDDGYRFGGTASQVRQDYLRDALAAVAAGRSPAVVTTAAPGCLVDLPSDTERARANPTATSIAFHPDVAGVLARNCLECHNARGSGPFSLASPADIKGRAAMVGAMVREEIMPPNHGLSWTGPAPMVHARRMPREDRELLLAWIESPRLIVDPKRSTPSSPATVTPPRSRAVDNSWAIGTPDFIVNSPGPTLAGDEPPKFGRYLVPVNLDEDQWVEAIECRPVMSDSVEVAQIWLIPPGERLPRTTELPAGGELLATYSRSDRVFRFGENAARRLPNGSVMVFDVLARSMGKPSHGQLRVAFKFSKSAGRVVRAIGVSPAELSIKPGEADVRVVATRTMEHATRLTAIQPVMGMRGRELTVELQVRGQSPVTLLDLRRYDWRWQIRYPLVEPLDVPAGARLVVKARFDNSETNPANPDASAQLSLGVGPAGEYVFVSLECEDTPGS